MAFCKNCGNQIGDGAIMCPQCGTMVAPVQQQPAQQKASFGWAVLGFFFPIVGLILFLVWKKDQPAKAKMAGIGALVGFIVNIVLSIVSSVLGAALGMAMAESSYYYY